MKKKAISGMLVTMFLVTIVTVTLPVRADWWVDTIEIGIVGPKGWIQWDGLWEGAQLARDLINKEGYFSTWPGPKGILGPDGRYKIVLVDIDEHAVPVTDPPAAISELLMKLNAHPNMYQLVGGFRTECVLPMEEALLDYAAEKKRPIWAIAGASTDELVSPLIDPANYEEYKYMFRNTPMNSTTLFFQVAAPLRQIIFPKMAALYGVEKVPYFVIPVNLKWADGSIGLLTGTAGEFTLGEYAEYVGHSRPSALETEFSTYFDEAEAAGAKIVIHVFAALAGANLVKQYGEQKREFALVGINVESQIQEFYASVDGACEYETFLSATGTQEDVDPVNPVAKPLTSTQFWATYKDVFGHCPLYTAWASFGFITGLNETSYDTDPTHASYGKGWMEIRQGILNGTYTKEDGINKMIKHTETLGVSEGYAWRRVKGYDGEWYSNTMQGLFRYTGKDGIRHDVFASPDCYEPLWKTPSGTKAGVARAWIVQWQAGRMEVTFPRDQPCCRKWMIPERMYSLETDFAGGPLVNTSIPIMDGEEIVGWYNYTTPDRIVYEPDFTAIAVSWFKDPLPFNLLEADMQPYDYKVDVYDAARVGMDWDKTETPK